MSISVFNYYLCSLFFWSKLLLSNRWEPFAIHILSYSLAWIFCQSERTSRQWCQWSVKHFLLCPIKYPGEFIRERCRNLPIGPPLTFSLRYIALRHQRSKLTLNRIPLLGSGTGRGDGGSPQMVPCSPRAELRGGGDCCQGGGDLEILWNHRDIRKNWQG